MTEAKPGIYDRIILSVPVLGRLERWMIDLGNRPSAMGWLLFISFLESIIFPIPMDPLLAIVVLARPRHYIRIALWTAFTSVLGGIVGWWIGLTLGKAVISMGWIAEAGAYAAAQEVLARHGWLVLFIGAFTPFPYKAVVVSAGFLGYGIVPVVLTSMVGRTARFVLVAAIVRHRQETWKAGGLTILLAVLMASFWWYIQ